MYRMIRRVCAVLGFLFGLAMYVVIQNMDTGAISTGLGAILSISFTILCAIFLYLGGVFTSVR